MNQDLPAKQPGLTQDQAQKVLDYVANRLNGTDVATAERLLEAFVDHLRGLDDIARVKKLIAQGDDKALEHLGGVQGAKRLIYLVETIGRR
jgi:hypothetical protein